MPLCDERRGVTRKVRTRDEGKLEIRGKRVGETGVRGLVGWFGVDGRQQN